jgi:hypothetical protein
MATNLPASHSRRVTEFLEKVQASHRGRVVFIVDATGSRERAWDLAAKLQADMFQTAATLGTLDLQLVYFRGMPGVDGECKSSPWTNDGHEMARLMSRISCRPGPTQIQSAVNHHVRVEHKREPITAAVYVGDMCEEPASVICDTVGFPGLEGVPFFEFQEGNDPFAEPIFKEMARLTKGAYCAFDLGAIAQLRDLLRAVAAFAVGGLTALADQRTESARKLLGQLK